MGCIYKYESCNWILSAEKRIPMFLDVYEDANWALMLPEQMSLVLKFCITREITFPSSFPPTHFANKRVVEFKVFLVSGVSYDALYETFFALVLFASPLSESKVIQN